MVEIAPLTLGEAEPIALLQNHLWRVTYRGLVPDAVLDTRDDVRTTEQWRERALAHEVAGQSPEGAVTLVAHDESGAPIGFASVGPPRDDDPPTGTELWALSVATEHQGTGVAARLLEAILPSSPVYLWVLRGNDRAIAFYRKVGFELDAVKHDGRLGAEEMRMVRAR